MKEAKDLFNYLSYLQYPILILALYYILKPLLFRELDLLESINKALLFYGLGIGFATLQDTTKTQNNFSLRIYQNPTKAKIFIYTILFMTLFFIGIGLLGLYVLQFEKLTEISIGCIGLGIGMIGVLKSVVEMAEHHSKPV